MPNAWRAHLGEGSTATSIRASRSANSVAAGTIGIIETRLRALRKSAGMSGHESAAVITRESG
jgi:hypothetical protein